LRTLRVAASALLWRFRHARADASEAEHGHAEQRALYVVSATFFALAAYIAFEAIQGLVSRDEPESSTVGLILSVVSLAVMPTLAYAKQRTGRALTSRALPADAVETWVCAYLSLALLVRQREHAGRLWLSARRQVERAGGRLIWSGR
jgi:divalent metal cation (Fe/Co/Zn/Cd) transporter